MNLDGVWKVTVTSGPTWFRALRGNKKYIKGGTGYNRLFGIKWGHFNINRWKKRSGSVRISLRYLNWHITDTLDIVDDNILKGRFYRAGKFIGNFNMIRKAP